MYLIYFFSFRLCCFRIIQKELYLNSDFTENCRVKPTYDFPQLPKYALNIFPDKVFHKKYPPRVKKDARQILYIVRAMEKDYSQDEHPTLLQKLQSFIIFGFPCVIIRSRIAVSYTVIAY